MTIPEIPAPGVRLCPVLSCGGVLPAENPDDLDQYPDIRVTWILIVGFCKCVPPHERWEPRRGDDLWYLDKATAYLYKDLREMGSQGDADG